MIISGNAFAVGSLDKEDSYALDFILNADNKVGDIALVFGNSLGKYLQWSDLNNRFELSDSLRVDGDLATSGQLFQEGNTLTLDSDNAGVGSNVDIIANQGSDSDGTLRYDATGNAWQVSNNGNAYENIALQTKVAQVYQSGTTTFGSAGFTAINWNGSNASARFVDSAFSHSTTVNASRVTVNEGGLFELSYSISWDTTANARRTPNCRFFLNGVQPAVPLGSTYAYSRNNTDDFGTNTSTFLYSLSTSDYVEIQCQNTGTTGNVTTLANQSSFRIKKVR